MIPSMSPKIRFQVMLEPEQLEALRRRQDETGVTVGELIRRAIDTAVPEVAGRRKKAARQRASTRKRA